MKAEIETVCDQCGRMFVKAGRVHKRCSPTCKKDAHRIYMAIYMREYRRGLRRRKALKRDYGLPLMAPRRAGRGGCVGGGPT